MDAARLAELSGWVTEAGLAGKSEIAILEGFCQRAIASGLPVAQVMVVIDTLHPVHEGPRVPLAPRQRRPAKPKWSNTAQRARARPLKAGGRSPFYRLLQSGGSLLRKRLGPGDAERTSRAIAELLATEGVTDYLALINRFAPEGAIGEMDCVYSHWDTDRPGGFADRRGRCARRLDAETGAWRSNASRLRASPKRLVETYLGRASGSPRARRAASAAAVMPSEQMTTAVLWYSDLRDFTRITDTI